MTKRIAILAALVAITATLAGCLRPPSPWVEAEERAQIAAALGGWVTGVEEYDVDAMAGGGILASGFKLIIKEGSARPYEKSATQLMEELLRDETNQLNFRKSPADGGAGYQLDFDVEWIITNIDRYEATVTGEFEVWETIDGGLGDNVAGHIVDGWWNSDNGVITVEMVRTATAWKITSMTIIFNPAMAPAAAARLLPTGLGIGRLPSML